MSITLILFAISLALWAYFDRLAQKPAGAGKICRQAGASAVLLLFCVSAYLALQCAVTFVAALACYRLKAKVKGVRLACLAATLIAFGGALIYAGFALRENARLRQRFPLESMANRLDYERRAEPSGGTAPVLSAEVAQRLDAHDARDGDRTGGMRNYLFARLHAKTANDFAQAFDFGVGRMPALPKPTSVDLSLPDGPPVPLKSPAIIDPPYVSPGTDDGLSARAEPPAPYFFTGKLLSMHEGALGDFLDPARMGYIQDRDHVAGFKSHGFKKIPNFAAESSPAWHIARLELVSLLKHERPVAYVSDNLPQMDRLRDAPTRPLDAFELAALDRLRASEDVVVKDWGGHIQMVGSLRAAKHCLECHGVQRGELLGALTYQLVPTEATLDRTRPDNSPPTTATRRAEP